MLLKIGASSNKNFFNLIFSFLVMSNINELKLSSIKLISISKFGCLEVNVEGTKYCCTSDKLKGLFKYHAISR